MHAPRGPLRELQSEMLREFAAAPGVSALGYEPPVESAQSSILELARSLGMEVISLEPDWRDLAAADREGARDLQAQDVIDSYLADDPAHRMFVIRGSGHVLPDGFLRHRLKHPALTLLSPIAAAQQSCEFEPDCSDKTFQLGSTGDVFALPYLEPSIRRNFEPLFRWLADQH